MPEVMSILNPISENEESLPSFVLPTAKSNSPKIGKRDEAGRFLAGNNGGGRKKGARNKLTEKFLEIVASDFTKHGSDALERVRKQDPLAYLTVVASLIPRELITDFERRPEIDYADLTDSEFNDLVNEEARRGRVKKILDQVRQMNSL